MFVRGWLRSGLLFILAAGCGSPYRDAIQVEGSWVGTPSWSPSECEDPERCEAIAQVAEVVLLKRIPDADVAEVRFHDNPTQRSDGTTVTVSLRTYNVVFTLIDSSRRLESFQCAIDGALTEGSDPAFGEFCDGPASNP